MKVLFIEKVAIINKNGDGHIKISPYDPQAEPVNIKKLNHAIKQEYGTINLIDTLEIQGNKNKLDILGLQIRVSILI